MNTTQEIAADCRLADHNAKLIEYSLNKLVQEGTLHDTDPIVQKIRDAIANLRKKGSKYDGGKS